MTNPNPSNSSHPTSLEAQAEKSGHAESVGRYHAWLKTEFPPIREDKQWLGEAASLSAWYTQDRHYQPIVESLKHEVEQTHREYDALKVQTDGYKTQVEALKAEVEELKRDNKELKAEIMICAKALVELADSNSIARDALGSVPKKYAHYLESLLNDNQNYTDTIREYRHDIRDLRKQIEQLTARNEELERKLGYRKGVLTPKPLD